MKHLKESNSIPTMRPQRYRRMLFFIISAVVIWMLILLKLSDVMYNTYTSLSIREERRSATKERWFNSDSDGEEVDEAKPLRPFSWTPENWSAWVKINASEDCEANLETDSWRQVTSSQDGGLFAFSAFYDGRLVAPLIRIMAVVIRKRSRPMFCLFLFPNHNGSFVPVRALVTLTSNNVTRTYSAGRLECVVPKVVKQFSLVYVLESETVPDSNSIVSLSSATSMPVHDRTPTKVSQRRNFALCVKPIHTQYDRAMALVEFFELHIILGVEHFYLYNHTIGSNVQRVIEYYVHLGLATVLPWQLDALSEEELQTEGKLVALSDCIYRTMFRYNYTLMVDFDEYIVPGKYASYSELVHHLQREDTGSFIFKNAFFYRYWRDDNKWIKTTTYGSENSSFLRTKRPYLITLSKTTRVHKTSFPLDRSKYIARPQMLIAPNTNKPEIYWPGYRSLHVLPSHGLLRHYRTCESGGRDCLRRPHVTDRSTWRFADQLLSGVVLTCVRAFPMTGECPMESPP